MSDSEKLFPFQPVDPDQVRNYIVICQTGNEVKRLFDRMINLAPKGYIQAIYKSSTQSRIDLFKVGKVRVRIMRDEVFSKNARIGFNGVVMHGPVLERLLDKFSKEVIDDTR